MVSVLRVDLISCLCFLKCSVRLQLLAQLARMSECLDILRHKLLVMKRGPEHGVKVGQSSAFHG